MISVSKKHGVSESHQISYLNGFVKIITDENGDKDFGFPTEDILLWYVRFCCFCVIV